MRAALVLVLLLVGVGVGGPSPASADAGPWGWPLAGGQEVAQSFAPPASRYGAGHRGVDLPSAPGAPVRASAQGRVTYAGLLAGRGVVVVTHGALRTTYEPVTATVTLGQEVALGEVVGQLEAGHLGCPVPACLHWGLRRGQEYLDPVRLVQRGPVRLLPVEAASDPLINAGLAHSAGAAEVRKGGVDQPSEGAQGAEQAGAARPVPPAEPAWSLQAAEAPLGAAAVAALVVGIGLLARPRPLPPSPVSGGMAAPAAPPADDPAPPSAALLDLDEARARRGVAS